MLDDAARRRVLVADQPGHLRVGLDRDTLGDEVGADHGLQVGRLVVVGVAALQQRRRIEVGLAAQLHDALGDHVGVFRLLVGVHQELVGDRRRGQALGGEMMALVAHDADEFGGQRVVEELDDVLPPLAGVSGRDRAFFKVVLRGVEGTLVEVQRDVLGAGLFGHEWPS